MEAKTATLLEQKNQLMKDRMEAMFRDVSANDDKMTEMKKVIAETAEAWDEIEIELQRNDPANYGKDEDEAEFEPASTDEPFLQAPSDNAAGETATDDRV
jgi:hypothetical protein